VLVATSIFLTLSRSGIVSLCLSMILFGLIFISRGKQKKRGIIIVTICILIVLSVGWFGWSPIFERFERIKNPQGDITELRLQIWHDSLNIIRDFPVYGTGFGSYENIYPKYRTIPGDGIADHAHNDYLELLSDGGTLAFVLCVWFLLAVFFRSYRTFRKRHETYSIYIFIASITGIIAILMHSVTDFNFHIGANGLYFFFLCGLAVSAAHTRLHDGLNDTYLEKKNVPLRIFAVLSGFLLASSVVFYFGIIMGQMTFSSVSAVQLSEKKSAEELTPVRDTAKTASIFDPLEPRYRYAAANAEKLLAHNEDALRYYRRALRLSPANAEYLQRYGLVLSEGKEYGAAESFLRTGIKYDVSNPVRYKRYACWLFSAGKRNDAEQAMKKAISMEPQKTRDYITFLILNGVSDQEILNALPDRVEPHLIYADYLERTGKDTMAEEAYLNALEYIRNEASVEASYFYAGYRYYHKRGRYPEALAIMNRAVAFLPDNPQVRIFAGELYERLGLVNKAREEYHNALVIHPGHQEAKRRLDTLIQSEKK
jgi:tetratricopeptide (TPR) repeat protein